MARLTRYLLRLFLVDTLALFGVAAFLLYLIQCIRLFDIVSDKGQSLLTLFGQAFLGMPKLGMVFLYVCIGIGIGRALRNMQNRSELQVIHVSGLIGALWQAIAVYLLGGAVLVLFLSHILDPLSERTAMSWTASIAADVVSRSMVPHRFMDVVPGVSMVIGSRDRSGNITDFFADDHRAPDTRRTYFAKSALITKDAEGYVLRLLDGAVQYMPASRQLAQVSFDRYDLALDNLTSAPGSAAGGPVASHELIQQAIGMGRWNSELTRIMVERSAWGVAVIALGFFVASIAAFPSGRRGRELPIEIVVLGGAFVERAVSSYAPGLPGLPIGTGSLLLLAAAAIILAVRLRLFRPAGIRRAAA